MKILKRPEDGGWHYPFTCTKCECELEAWAEDLKYYKSSGEVHDRDSYFFVICCVCEMLEIVGNDNVPKWLARKLREAK